MRRRKRAATTQRAALCHSPYKHYQIEFKFVNQQSVRAYTSGAQLDLA